MVDNDLTTDIEARHLVIAKLQPLLDQQATELSLKRKPVEEQAHGCKRLSDTAGTSNSELLALSGVLANSRSGNW